MKTTNRTIFRTRTAPCLAAATMLVAAGALGSAAPASAQPDWYAGLAYSLHSRVAGLSYNMGDPQTATTLALQDCQNKGGGNCVVYYVAKNECAALAVFGAQEWSVAAAGEVHVARQLALKKNGGGQIGVSGCARNYRPEQRTEVGPTG